jgi:hypothetical protein
LQRSDFTTAPHDLFGTPPSSRFLSRWGSAGELKSPAAGFSSPGCG